MFIKLKIPSQRISNKSEDYLVSMTSHVSILYERWYINSNVCIYGQPCLDSMHGQSFRKLSVIKKSLQISSKFI